jgi:hypothetical protein
MSFDPVEEEDHPGEEQKVVVARHHVLGAEVDEGDGAKARHLLHIARVAFGDVVGKGRARQQQGGQQGGSATRACQRQWGAPGRPIRDGKDHSFDFPD